MESALDMADLSAHLPGHGLSLDYKPDNCFPTALPTGFASERSVLTLRELSMIAFMDQITDKPNWENKVFDETIVAKWKTEVDSAETLNLSEKSFDWCIAELRHKTKHYKETGCVESVDGVFKSDSAIPNTLKHALRRAISPLENIPDHEKDWHPGSDGLVLDLVHPSLYPLVYGLSRILENKVAGLNNCMKHCGSGKVTEVPARGSSSAEDDDKSWSTRFQWLPCNLVFAPDGRNLKIESYINNLHPEIHRDLYNVIEQIISRTLPLWNSVLTCLTYPRQNRLQPDRDNLWEIHYDEAVVDGWETLDDFEDSSITTEEALELETEWGTDEESLIDARRERHKKRHRTIVHPEPGEFLTPEQRVIREYGSTINETKPVDLARDYKNRGLQVIVKLASIILDPENPTYGGGTWHVEGQQNEHICASAIYYYDSHNITESRLTFRQGLYDGDMVYVQNEHESVELQYGIMDEGPRVQELGSALCREDRLLAFPNILQHRVPPFRLADYTKPGHRKILALFLVDPNIHIISTANVPAQQKSWWMDEVRRGPLGRLTPELFEKIMDDVDYPIPLETAHELREELMDERTAFVDYQKDYAEDYHAFSFSLCEH